jgi:hypothetical protein
MTKYRGMMALLAGAGFSSLAILLLNLDSAAASSILSFLLLPGWAISELYSRSKDLYSPLIVLAANAVAYGGLAYFLLGRYFSRINTEKARYCLALSAVPAIALVSLACVPSLNPMWPVGMQWLAQEEAELHSGLPVGSQLDQSRAFLRARGIAAYEQEVKVGQEIPRREGPSFAVRPGDRLVSARIATDAGQFPCGYAIELGLVFDANGVLRENHVDRLRLCP